MNTPKELIDLQWQFHVLPEEDYCKETPAYKSLMKKYNALNQRLLKQGFTKKQVMEMYIDTERGLEEDDNPTETAFIIDADTVDKIMKNR